MSLLVIAIINAIAALAAHALATRKGRNADLWTFMTALFAPALLGLLALSEKQEPHAETVPVEVRA